MEAISQGDSTYEIDGSLRIDCGTCADGGPHFVETIRWIVFSGLHPCQRHLCLRREDASVNPRELAAFLPRWTNAGSSRARAR